MGNVLIFIIAIIKFCKSCSLDVLVIYVAVIRHIMKIFCVLTINFCIRENRYFVVVLVMLLAYTVCIVFTKHDPINCWLS